MHLRSKVAVRISHYLYGEVGKRPLHVTIDKRLMSFWLLLPNKDESSLAYIVHMIAHNVLVRDVYKAMMDTNHAKPLYTRESKRLLCITGTHISPTFRCVECID